MYYAPTEDKVLWRELPKERLLSEETYAGKGKVCLSINQVCHKLDEHSTKGKIQNRQILHARLSNKNWT